MRIAITGATGFIGGHLVRKHIELGDEVRILTRKKSEQLSFPAGVEIIHADLLDASQKLNMFLTGVDVLYHCAAEIKDEERMHRVNVEGTANLIAAAKGKIGHWVQLSSTGVYGALDDELVDEHFKPHPRNNYEKTKLEADALVLEAARKGDFTFTILRPSNVFGPDMTNQSLFQLVKAVDKGLFFSSDPKEQVRIIYPLKMSSTLWYYAEVNRKRKEKFTMYRIGAQ